MAQPARPSDRGFTWEDYQQWPDDQRWEIIDGEAYDMSPPPTPRHQDIVGNLFHELKNHFRDKPCKPYVSPIGMKLSDLDIVQPDLLIVCKPEQVKRTHIEGTPTLVIEILSPHSTAHDRLRKTRLYERFGVAEYWIVTPWPSLVEVFVLDGKSYRLHGVFGKEDTLSSPTFPDLKLALDGIFDFPLEPDELPPAVREPPAAAYRS